MNEREFPFIAAYRIALGGLGQRLMDMHDWHRARGLKTYQGCRDRRGDDLEYGRWCFADRDTARAFIDAFGGEMIDIRSERMTRRN